MSSLVLSLSAKELNILRVLQDNPNRPQKDIAKECGVSEPTLSKLIKRIKDEGGIRRLNALLLDPEKFGFTTLSFFRVQCEYSSIASITEVLVSMREIQEVHQFFGTMDSLLLKVHGHSSRDLSEIQSKVRALEGVREVKVDPVLMKKEESNLPL